MYFSTTEAIVTTDNSIYGSVPVSLLPHTFTMIASYTDLCDIISYIT
jgi:hypothetical protein